MFQNFANYFLGSVLNQNQEEAAEEVIDVNNIRLRTSEEHDWVLVDRDSEGNYEINSYIIYIRSYRFRKPCKVKSH